MTLNNNKPRCWFHKLFILSSVAAALVFPHTAMAQQCDFYPIALSAQQVSNAVPGTVLNVANGAQTGNFGWLSWGGSPSETALVASLAVPGNSSAYVNPDVPNDHQISIGDWVSAKPGVSNSKGVRDALDALKSVDITVPVWDKTRGTGDHAAYHVANFARVRLVNYQLPGQNKITARFLGSTSCGLANVAPVVNAGADASVFVHTMPGMATLTGSVSDDGLPASNGLTTSWSVLSGAGTVTFGNISAPTTTATFSAAGIYVLQLSANDGELTSSDTVTVSVNRTNQAPQALAQTIVINEDTVATIALDGNDADFDALTFQVATLPHFGTLSGTPPNVVYTPKQDFNGTDNFTFTVNDGQLDSAPATVNITIQPVNDAPVADAISVTNNENTSATITLSGSDVEGSALTYVLSTTPTHGTLSVGAGTLASPQLTYTPAADFSGTDSFTFKVNDGDWDSGVATVSITVVAVNQAPDVAAGADQLVSEPIDTVALAGVVTDDNFPGNTVTVQWSKVSGPGAVTFMDETSRTTGAMFSATGFYVLRLTATDGQFETSDDVQVTVNAAPVVSAGDTQTITLPDVATLNGSATDDRLPVGSVLSVSWEKLSGPGAVVFDDAHSVATTASFSQSGVYVLRLTATDSLVSRDSDVTVTVNHVPVVDAGSERLVTNLEAVLNGTVFDDGLPNGTLTTSWTQVSGPGTATFVDASSAASGVTFSASGVYVLQLTADDSLAQNSASVTISVDGAPVVSATSGSPVNFGNSVTLNGTATDDGLPNGSTVAYAWSYVSGPGAVSFADATAAQTTASFSASGTYVLQFAASDSLLSASTTVTVIMNGAPTVDVSADKTLVRLPQTVALSGIISDDGLPTGTMSLGWSEVTGPGAVSFSNPTGTNTTASFSAAGFYTLRLTADDSLATASSDITIQVLPANHPPVVNAGPSQAVNFPNAIALNGTFTDDGEPQGATVTSTWTQVNGPGIVSFGDIHATTTSATASQGGVYVLRLTADDTLASSSADVTVKFNRAPLAQAQSITTPEGQATPITLSGMDADGDTLQFVVTQQPLLGTLTGTAPNLQYTSYAGAYGADSFQFYVTDGMLTSAVATVSIQVTPIARGRTYTLNSDFLEGNIVNLQATNDQLQLLRAGSGSWSFVFDSGLINAPWAGLSWDGVIANDGALLVSVATSHDGKSYSALQPISLENSQPTNTGRFLEVVVDFVPATSGEKPTLQDMNVGSVGWPVPVAAPQWQISAGDDISAFWPDPVQLKGVVWHSPHNILVNPAIQWSLLSGPGTVTYDDATTLQPTVQFSTNGTYQFRITANYNGDIQTDDVTVTTRFFNRAPVANAGANLFVQDYTTGATTLQGSATDDGLPLPSTLKIGWTQLFGPGTTTFANSNNATTSATFSTNGIYVLQLSADDGQFASKAITTVRVGVLCTVNSPAGQQTWWQADGSGSDAVDGSQAVLETGANYLQGKVGGAFNFDGVNARASVAANSHLDIANASNTGFTVECWINPNNFLNGAVLGWTNGVRLDRVTAGSAAGDTLRFYVTGTNSGQFVDSARNWPNTAVLSNWYHYAATYDRASGVAKVYFNGVLQNSAVVGSTNTLSTSAEFFMGQVAGAAGAFKGQLDEISLYSRALDPEDIYNIFASGAAGKCPVGSNQPPVVDAGPDLFLQGVPATATLNGHVSDDGLPIGSSARIQWSKLTGPGTVTFANPNSAVTSATFGSNGVYVLQLSANDQDIVATSFVEVRVETLCTIDDSQGLVAWWTGNNNDLEMLNGFDAVQGSGTGYTNGKVASAFSFNGLNNYVWMPAQSNYDVGQSIAGFTLEFWMNPNSFQNGSVLGWANGVRVERRSAGSAAGDSLRFFVGGTNSGQFLDSQRAWPTATSLNQWYHIAITYDRTSGQANIYTNGVLQSTGTVGTSVMSTERDFYLGQVPGSANFFSGGLDEISIYKRPLNPEEVYSVFASGSAGKCPEDSNQPPIVYAGEDLFVRGVPGTATLNGQVIDDNLPVGSSVRSKWSKFSGPGSVAFANASAATTSATFSSNGVYVLQLTADDGEAQSSDLVEVRVETLCTVEHAQGLAAWWPGNGASDELISGYHAELGSGTTYTNGKVAAAFNFNGVNNFVLAPAQTNYDVGSSAAGFTVEFWMNPNSLQNASVLGWANGVRVDRTTSGSAAGDTLRFFVTGTNSGQFLLAARPWSSVATLNQWYHIALTYDRATGQTKAYTNGVLLATGTVGTNVMSTSGDFYLGQVPGSAGFFSGGLDEVSLYKRALNPEEIYSVFSSGSAGKCPEDNNQAPVVYAGPDQTLAGTNNIATLSGFVSDDGLPTGSTLRTQWSKIGGPGAVTFNNSNSVATAATFSTNGVYVLQLTADDSEVRSSSTMQVRVGIPCTVSDPAGLVAFWPGNATSDDVINSYHALMGSGTTYTNGKVATAFSFNGVNNYVLAPAQTNYDISSSASGFSLEFWMNPNSFQNATVLGWNNGVRVDRVTSGSAPGDTLRFVLGGTNAGQFVLGARPWGTAASLNQWCHIGLTYDRTLGQAKVYTNGVLLATATVSNVFNTIGDFYLGQVPNAPGFFSGGLDEISLYNRPLTLSEIQAVFNTGVSGKCITQSNRAPFVSAGGNRTIKSPTNSVTLFGAVYDDGKPANALSVAWNYVSGPSTVFFSSVTNPVTTVTFTNTGVYTFQLSASDNQYVSSDTAVVTVTADPRTPPTVAISGLSNGTGFEVPNNSSTATAVITAAASDKDGVVSRVDIFEDNLLLTTLSVPPYTTTVTNVLIGSHTFTAVATDNDGLSTTSAPISIIVYVDSLPVAAIFNPAEAALIAGPTAIVGTATSPILQQYQLQYRFKQRDDVVTYPWTTIANSNSPVVSNVVAVFDPSLLLNGIYEIQLSTTDTKGRTATSAIQTLLVSQNIDLTNFTASFSDLTIETPGLPIQITRTYDSRDHRTNDFGIGWSLDIRNVCLQKSANLATNWFSTVDNSLYSLDALLPHRVMITMAGNKTFQFEAALTPSEQAGSPIAATRMTFTNLLGTDGTLEIDGNNRVNVSGIGGTLGFIDLIDFTTSEFFNPTRFKFTTAEGNVYIIDEKAGLMSLADTNLNTLTITTNGISHSSGVNVTFTPDNLGRIQAITDAVGNQLQYGYGADGNLATFTDFATNTTVFDYNNTAFPNLLTDITDTNGVHPITLTPTKAGN